MEDDLLTPEDHERLARLARHLLKMEEKMEDYWQALEASEKLTNFQIKWGIINEN